MLELVLVVAVKLCSFSCLGDGTVLGKLALRKFNLCVICCFDPI